MTRPIILIGPTAPYRGGIAQYNTALFRELRSSPDVDCRCYSFSRQYPKWLYPGETDLDPDQIGHVEPHVQYTLDSINPLTWWRTARSIVKTRPSLVILHWWTFFFAPCFLVISLLAKMHRIPVALICHNLVDHEGGWAKSLASKAMLGVSDGFIVHSQEHERQIATASSSKPTVRYPIPTYDNFPEPKGTLAKRGRLELLFFGFIRPYKGLDLLIEALAGLQDEEVHLTVVGEPWSEPDAIVRQAATAPSIELHLSYSSAEQVAEYFARSDILVLPYREATGSAVASIATHYGKPILATRVGGLPDVVRDGLNGILIPPNDIVALRDAIRSLDRHQTRKYSANVQAGRSAQGWASAAQGIITLSERLSGR